MTITQIENNITKLVKNFSQDSFVFDFLLAYGEPKATVTRLKKGDLNQLESKGELTQRKKLFFKVATTGLHGTIDTLRTDSTTQKQKPRFIMVTDYETLLAYDTKTTDTLDIKLMDLVKHYDFFLPLAGMEKSTHIDENPADVKASNQLAKLYDEILKNNPTSTHEEVHALNVFLTRLLFCYFAEDSNIFDDNLFTNSISNHTQVDGSDIDSYLERLFDVFNTDDKDREVNLPEYLKAFPYVNGGLFRDKHPLPKFTIKSRNIMIDIGGLDWSAINPDIFPKINMGSMACDGGHLILFTEEKNQLIATNPQIETIIKPLFGSAEFIQGKQRWAIWIEDDSLEFSKTIPQIQKRIEKVYKFRVESKAKTTNAYASIPHKFAQRCFSNSNPIIIPRVSSERRVYIPMGFLNKGSVVTDSTNVIYDAKPWLLAILTSKMHMIWMRTAAGRLKTDYRYSSVLVYNTFPFQTITQKQKDELTKHTFNILDEREQHSEKTLAQLYDPDKMPQDLKEAHHQLDLAIEKCYRNRPFENDEERLEYLFGLYEEMIEKERNV